VKRLFLSVALLCAASSSSPASDEPGRDTVLTVTRLIETKKWWEAGAFFTEKAIVIGVPSEVPEKRWTKTAAEFLKEKPDWSFGDLKSQFFGHGKTATMRVEFRHAHLRIHSTWELVEVEGRWKVDTLRFATRRDTSTEADELKKLRGTSTEAEELKKLRGTWSYQGKENELLRAMKLTIEPDRFQLDLNYFAIGIALAPGREVEFKRSGTKIRVNPAATPKTIELEWKAETVGEWPFDGPKFRGIYKLDGDQLLLMFRPTREGYPRDFDDTSETFSITLKRQ
jgi:uncharacterized protein (TIGR03067 family)